MRACAWACRSVRVGGGAPRSIGRHTHAATRDNGLTKHCRTDTQHGHRRMRRFDSYTTGPSPPIRLARLLGGAVAAVATIASPAQSTTPYLPCAFFCAVQRNGRLKAAQAHARTCAMARGVVVVVVEGREGGGRYMGGPTGRNRRETNGTGEEGGQLTTRNLCKGGGLPPTPTFHPPPLSPTARRGHRSG